MNSVDCLVDIARTMSVIDRDGMIKVIGSASTTYAVAANGRLDQSAIDAACASGIDAIGLASVVAYFKSNTPIPELANRCIGLSLLNVLTGIAEMHATSNRQFVYENERPIEICFDRGDGELANYRLMSRALAEIQVDVPPFVGKTCEVMFCPSSAAIKMFDQQSKKAALMGNTRCWPMMNSRGYLFFSFDLVAPSKATDRFEMARNLPYVQLPPYSYYASDVRRILSLANGAKSVKIGLSVQGYMRIEIDSEFGVYQFVCLGSDQNVWRWNLTEKWPEVWSIDRAIADDRSMHGDWEPDL